MSQRVTIAELASLAGVTPRALKKAALAIISGKRTTWRGAPLAVFRTHGRGGNSGLSYEIRTDSLPPNLQALLEQRQIPLQPSLKLDDAAAVERNHRSCP